MNEIRTEQDIGRIAAAWLEAQGFTVYHEVHLGGVGGTKCADLVGIKQVGKYRLVHVIECKVQYGINVLDQAAEWIGLGEANLVSVATFRKRSRRRRGYWRRSNVYDTFHRVTGIGHFEIDARGNGEWQEEPRLHRRDRGKRWHGRLVDSCSALHTTGEFAQAGAQSGHRLTAFRLTCLNLIDAVRANPGQRVRVYVEQISHHYASNKSAAANLGLRINEGVVKELRAETDNRGAFVLFLSKPEVQVKTEFKFIRFIRQDPETDKARPSWRCTNKNGHKLGRVVWFPKWKRYVFMPTVEAVYDHQCMTDIAEFLAQELK